jgi:hypothetical protein
MISFTLTVLQLTVTLLTTAQTAPGVTAAQQQQALTVATQAVEFAQTVVAREENGTLPAVQLPNISIPGGTQASE